jgi:hypothetical protein
MASKKPTTTTQPVKTPKTVKTKKPKGYDDLVFKNEKSSLKLKKTTKEDPVPKDAVPKDAVPKDAVPKDVENTPIPKKRNVMEKGSQAALEWSIKMKLAREKKKAERIAQTTPVAV